MTSHSFALRSLLFAAAAFFTVSQAATTTLISAGSAWRYLDDGSNQGTAWSTPSFDDSGWQSGAAQLGYGDGDEATVISYGINSGNKYITTYFRHAFNVADPAVITSLTMRVLRDDGAIVYINGTEVFRSNMPSGTVTYATPASTALGAPAESTFVQTTLSPEVLVAGANSIAVEIHQANSTSSDVSFDLDLTASDSISVVRGPYLQMSTPTSIRVRWRTDGPTDSVVRFGLDAANLDMSVQDAVVTTDHEVTLSLLQPNTRYFYSVGSSSATLGSGADMVFYSPPEVGSAQPVRVWVLGDSGTGDANAQAVRDAYYAFSSTRYTDVLLMLGDNAYQNGTDSEFQAAVFNMYPDILKQTVLWPALGNHDTAGASVVGPDLPYFQMFSLPEGAEAGGLASGTEKYYSFNFGNIHFICLDSMTSDRTAAGPMLSWLRNDLAANTALWTIAYWHHPPYSKGSHDSDTDAIQTQMRQNALPILEEYGVDLVLCGHSHSYERSYLLDGHYGTSGTLGGGMVLDGGDGRPDGTGAYNKPTEASAGREGAVYVVAGSSGKISGGALNHPAMIVSLNLLGSMVLDVEANRLNVKFLTDGGSTADYFSIVKGTAVNLPPAVNIASPAEGAVFEAPANITIAAAALDNDGAVSGVAFFFNNSLIGSDSDAPFEVNWTGVPQGAYVLTAVATDNLGAQAASAAVNITVVAPAPPSAPQYLTAAATSSSQITLNWTDTAANEEGFRIERSTDSVVFTQIAVAGAGQTSFHDAGLAAATTYHYRVSSFNSAGTSGYSNTASSTTFDPAPEAPAAPAALAATAVSKTQINLSWSDNSGNEQGFKIEQSTNGTKFRQIATVGAGVSTFSDTGLQAGKRYFYRVRAYNVTGDSGYSNVASASTPRK